MSALYGNGMDLIEKTLDLLWGRETVTMSNIANVDTPGYKSQYVTFEEVLKRRIKNASTGARPRMDVNRAIHSTQSSLVTTNAESSRLDGNNVDMDQEQVDLVRTVYEYQYMLSSINSEINRLRNAAKTF